MIETITNFLPRPQTTHYFPRGEYKNPHLTHSGVGEGDAGIVARGLENVSGVKITVPSPELLTQPELVWLRRLAREVKIGGAGRYRWTPEKHSGEIRRSAARLLLLSGVVLTWTRWSEAPERFVLREGATDGVFLIIEAVAEEVSSHE
jgi:hypothetical protein